MQYLSKEMLKERLELILEKSDLVMRRNGEITSYRQFLLSPASMEKFDAACMLIQVIGETARRIDDMTSSSITTSIATSGKFLLFLHEII